MTTNRKLLAGMISAGLFWNTSALALDIPPDILNEVQQHGTARVIVELDVPWQPEGMLRGADAVVAQRQQLADTQQQFVTTLSQDLVNSGLFDEPNSADGTPIVKPEATYETIPYLVLEVSEATLPLVQQQSLTKGLTLDQADEPSLTQSLPLIGADKAGAAGYTGKGQMIAVLDTGVDKSHPFFASNRVVQEACFSATLCPDGQKQQVSAGAAVPCGYDVQSCLHGTHVAGIAASVAKEAQLIAVQVFSKQLGMAKSLPSDQLLALDWLHKTYGNPDSKLAAVNLSLGGGKFASACDDDPRKKAIDNLRSVGIATIIASGNQGYSDGINSPACTSSAISVGATNNSDEIWTFSNSASMLSLLAPGVDIFSSVPGGQTVAMDGTSMAAPHVAGAWAVLKAAKPTATVDEVLTTLQSTGKAVTGKGVTKARVQLDKAVATDCDIVKDGLILCLPVDGDAKDYSGKGLDGILQGNVNFVEGAIGKAIQLDGTGYIRVPHSDTLNVNQHTIAAWVSLSKSTNGTVGGAVVGKVMPVRYETLHLSARGQHFATGFTTEGEIVNHPVYSKSPVTADNKWHFIVLTYDGAYVKFYINGVLDVDLDHPPTPRTGIVRTNEKELAIGRHCGDVDDSGCDDPMGLFRGSIDEVRIYNRAISDSEVKTLYQLAPKQPVVFNCANVTEELPQAECETLVTLYKNTQGSAWTDNATNKWLQTNTPCSWTGITCADRHVKIVIREAQNLVGVLPDFSALTALQFINLNKNQITGSLTGPLPKFSNTLKELRLADNQLTGTLPDFAAQYPNLQVIGLGINQLSGTIPDLSKLTKLMQFDVWGNELNGNIPNLPKSLRGLNLGQNQLTGVIPDLSALITDLRSLNLSYNQFTPGPVPNLSKFTNLWYLRMVSDNLTGPVPAELSNLVLLQMLDLSHNDLTGEIPNLDKLTSLEHLGFDSNQLEGPIPGLKTFTKLEYLALSSNPSLCQDPQNDYAGRTEVEAFPICGSIVEPAKVTLTVTKTGNGTVAGQGIDCGTDCTEANLAANTQVTLTATPDTGYQFVSWAGACTGTDPTTTVTLTADQTCAATFELIPPPAGIALTVNKADADRGRVSGRLRGETATSLTCDNACQTASYNYPKDGVVILIATADKGYEFKTWTCTGSSYTQDPATSNILKVTMTTATTCTANFDAIPGQLATLTVNLIGTGNGTVISNKAGLTCSGQSCTGTYVLGQKLTLTATPSVFATFLNWGSDCTGNNAKVSLTLTKDLTCTAQFQSILEAAATELVKVLYTDGFLDNKADVASQFALATNQDRLKEAFWLAAPAILQADSNLVATQQWPAQLNGSQWYSKNPIGQYTESIQFQAGDFVDIRLKLLDNAGVEQAVVIVIYYGDTPPTSVGDSGSGRAMIPIYVPSSWLQAWNSRPR